MNQQRAATVGPAAGRDGNADSRRVARGGFDMHAHHRAITGQSLRTNAQTVKSFFQTQFQFGRFRIRMTCSR